LKIEYKNKYRNIGLRIAYFRKMKGLTQEELAEAVDKSVGYISAIEAVKVDRAISLDLLFDIEKILGIPAHKFLQFDDESIKENEE